MSRYAINSLLYRLKKDRAFRERFNQNPVGTLAGLDLFFDPGLFAREWPKLLRAQALDVYGRVGTPDTGEAAAREAVVGSERAPGAFPPTEVTLMMRPQRWARMIGSTSRQHRTAAWSFSSRSMAHT